MKVYFISLERKGSKGCLIICTDLMIGRQVHCDGHDVSLAEGSRDDAISELAASLVFPLSMVGVSTHTAFAAVTQPLHLQYCTCNRYASITLPTQQTSLLRNCCTCNTAQLAVTQPVHLQQSTCHRYTTTAPAKSTRHRYATYTSATKHMSPLRNHRICNKVHVTVTKPPHLQNSTTHCSATTACAP